MRPVEGGQRQIDVPAVAGLPVDQSLGNLEGKELRFGTSAGATWAAFTTNTSNGSVNCMHDSLNPLAGITPLTGMWLNCIWGGVGVGLINFLIYLIVGVFLAGLMVGRTPEYLGKKVEAREMKLAMLALLDPSADDLGSGGIIRRNRLGIKHKNNPAAHGFSEILYEFTSASANNGSGFEGLADTVGFAADNAPPRRRNRAWDIACGLVMLISRFIPIIAPIAIAGSLAAKKADALHRRHAADRHRYVWLRSVGHDLSGRRLAVPAGGRTRSGRRAPRPATVRRLDPPSVTCLYFRIETLTFRSNLNMDQLLKEKQPAPTPKCRS